MNQEESSTDFKEFLEGMSEHLIELRNRLIVIVLSLCFAIIIAFFFSDSIMAFLARPIGGLEKLQSIEITENFTAVFRVVLLAGLVLDSPVIFYEILAFILPALKSNEKRILFTFLPLLILFFIAGILFAFFILLPAAIPFLISFTDIPTTIRTSSYFSFTTNMLFWIGVVFEMPIFIYFLTKVKVVNSGLLLKKWRQAVVICAILAMLITPTVDPVNMTILLIPLVLLYFLSILFAKIAER
ncbi:MAG TPA: twin-arginine translocase subunit TatC [Flexilinea sp.]|nr:twin-arginine translocase subunit TatC [Flexilinea sp.]HOW06595.1 twin-arginine translocase subunit TatC [Flexilinea sp.]HPS48303.1 twin-arginine translocase subunit TatC [Flexilinea sp.]